MTWVVIICHNLWKAAARSEREQNHNLSSPVGSNRHISSPKNNNILSQTNGTNCWCLSGPGILTDNANRAFQGNVAMKVTQPCGQLWNHCKWHYMMAKFRTKWRFSWLLKFGTSASAATWWSNWEIIQVAQHVGKILTQCKRRHLVAKFVTNASLESM